MRFSGNTALAFVIVQSILGVFMSSQGEFFTAFLAFVIAGADIAYYDQALQTAKALELAKECLAGWKEALDGTEP